MPSDSELQNRYYRIYKRPDCSFSDNRIVNKHEVIVDPSTPCLVILPSSTACGSSRPPGWLDSMVGCRNPSDQLTLQAADKQAYRSFIWQPTPITRTGVHDQERPSALRQLASSDSLSLPSDGATCANPPLFHHHDSQHPRNHRLTGPKTKSA